MISYDQALALVLERAEPFGVEIVALHHAANRVLAHDLVGTFPLPRFDNSAVDGYALGHPDQTETWRVAREVFAGDSPGSPLAEGECVRIFTGAPVPPGTSTVVMQEDAEIMMGEERIRARAERGKNIRRAGEEVEAGAVVLDAKTTINAAGIGVAATLGLDSIPVFRAPRVGILVTGAELVAPGSELSEGQIFESNRAAVTALLGASGISPEYAEVVSDSPQQTEGAFRRSLECCDVVIVTGGISVGDRDIVRSTLEQLGVEEVFWKVAIKPGKPVYMGRFGGKTVFGLPGNPLSVIATYTLLVKPFLRAVMGFAEPGPDRVNAKVSTPVSHKLGRREFIPAVIRDLSGDMVVSPILGQGSHMLSGMARANSFIDMPAEVEGVYENERVSVVLL